MNAVYANGYGTNATNIHATSINAVSTNVHCMDAANKVKNDGSTRSERRTDQPGGFDEFVCLESLRVEWIPVPFFTSLRPGVTL
jgi:hypothetical protein